jgi:hypothetical protein
MAAPARIEPQRAPGSAHEPTKSADGSEVNGHRLKAYCSSVATSTLDKSGLLMEVVMPGLLFLRLEANENPILLLTDDIILIDTLG